MLTPYEVRAIIRNRSNIITDKTMPSLKVYKDGPTMIPVDSAKIAKAYVCPWTSDLFSTKRGYVNHLGKLRKTRMHARSRRIIKQKRFDDLANQPTMDKLINWIHINPEFFFDNALSSAWQQDRQQDRVNKMRADYWIKIFNLDVNYSESVSNSHSCPKNGVSNFGGRECFPDGKPRPRGYPGFRGKIIFQLSHNLGWASDVMKNTGLHIGSGGGSGNLMYHYEFNLFLDDFPVIKAAFEEEEIQYNKGHLLTVIKNQSVPSFSKKYQYNNKVS